MEKMNMFGSNSSKSFEETLLALREDLGIAPSVNVKWYNGFESYFKNLYDYGTLEHNEYTDKLLKMSAVSGQTEYDISFGYLEAVRFCLQRGAHVKDVLTKREAVIAVQEYCELAEPSSALSKELSVATLLRNDDYFTKIVKSLTGKDHYAPGVLGIALKYLLDLVEASNASDEQLKAADIPLMDKLLCLSYMSEGNSYEKSLELFQPFYGKGYPYNVARVLIGKFGNDLEGLPVYSELFGLLVINECKRRYYVKGELTLSELLNMYNILSRQESSSVTPERLAVYNVMYDAGFTIKFVKEYLHTDELTFTKLADLVERATEKFNYDKPMLSLTNGKAYSDYFYNGKRVQVLAVGYVFELLRQVIDNVEISDYDAFDDWSYSAYSLYKWYESFSKYVRTAQSCMSIRNEMHKDFSEIRITLDGITAFHIPTDFFMESYDVVTAWLKEQRPQLCVIEATKMPNGGSSLLFRFTTSGHLYYVKDNKTLGLTVDIETKKELIFNSDLGISSPLLKVMLYERFNKAGKDTSILEKLDVQTIIAMVQVLVLQHSEDYETLFGRPDMFINGFKSLKWCVRSDDNFFSALARYVMASAGIDSDYLRTSISKSLQNGVSLGGNVVPLTSVFAGNNSIIDYLKQNKNSINVKLEGDVLYFG